MTTCEQYIRKRWPGQLGLDVLHGVCSVLRSGRFSTEDMNAELHFIISLSERHQNTNQERLKVEIECGDVEKVISEVQILARVALIFRPPPSGSAACSSGQIRTTSAGLEVTLDDLLEPRGDPSVSCRHPLVRRSVIVSGFPKSSGEPGLELPFPILLDLAGIIYSTDLARMYPGDSQRRGIFYSDVNSVLYPVRSVHQAGKELVVY